MAVKRLVKVAKELNVGTSTIIDYLTGVGYEIEDKPTSKISEEMYNELLQKFHGLVEIKEQAEQMTIGSKSASSEKTLGFSKKESSFSKPGFLEPLPDLSTLQKEKKEEKPVEASSVEKVKPEEKENEASKTKDVPKLKVLGNIDIPENKAKTKKKEEKKEKEVKPADSGKEEQVVPKTPEQQPEEHKPAESPESVHVAKSDEEKKTEEPAKDDIIRVEAPTLKGLTTKGKVSLDSLKRKEKPDKNKASNSQEKKRRKRKRRKITAEDISSIGKGRKRGGPAPKQEIDQQEIEKKIKQIQVKLSGGVDKSGKKRKRKLKKEKREAQEEILAQQAELEAKILQVTEFITANDLAALMNESPVNIIQKCFELGMMVSINQRLDAEIIELIADEFGFEVEFQTVEESFEEEDEIIDSPEDLQPRSPIVTVMGHVDHGKTSLLDYIRKGNVAMGEAGGITQHIGAYEAIVDKDSKQSKVTFLDTPGHEAFTAMRARGAKITDVAIIIIAADDKIMPQTKEAISHAQAAGVPMVFAINKIDKPGADPERIKQELAAMDLLIEEWGGKYQSQDISAKTGQGVDELLEKVLLEAEMLELKANPNRPAVGAVIEASLDKGRGYVTNVLIQNGTLRIGDVVIAGIIPGKVRAMFNEKGQRIKEAGPATPVLMLGMQGAPQAGEHLKVVESEKEVKRLAAKRTQIQRELSQRTMKRISLDEIGRRLALGNFKELNIIVKADVDGSVEALSDSLLKLSNEEVSVNVIHKAVGQITESDVLLASASDAIIIGFQVRPSLEARKMAEHDGVQIKTYNVIYKAIDEVKQAIEGLLEPTKTEKVTANVEVREVFKVSKVGTVAGCYVRDGAINRNSLVRVVRNGILIFPTKEKQIGELASLKRFKDDVKEVKQGLECGIAIKNFNDIKVGDEIEAYEIVELKRTL